jgi:lipopolysaccharide biosynthesis glycosyltransferase
MKIFVGYDPREDIAYRVCEYSIKARSQGVEVIPLKQSELREAGIYTREPDTLSSTEFTFTRFLVPHLTEYTGWAIFCDCDFLFQCDVEEIFKQAQDQYAVMCVQHDYTPPEGDKMDGCKQLPYPRKNWSSLILWNCGHPANRALTPEAVSSEQHTGQFFHRFQWLPDDLVGPITHEYNWLVNWYHEPEDGRPKAIHYTEGGPWFDNYKFCEYGYQWAEEKNRYERSLISPPVAHKFATLPDEMNNIINKMIEYRMDSNNEYYTVTRQELIDEIDKNLSPKRVFAVDSEFRYARKGNIYDPMLEHFMIGAGGQITTWDMIESNMTPVVIRGIAKRKQIHSCWETGRDFYYIDTGYFGNGKRKLYHRITKNHLQNIYPIVTRPRDRLSATGWRPSKFRKGSNILVCPPSAKVMKFFDLDLDQWMEETMATLKNHTDRNIVVRLKQSRSTRMHDDTLAMALSNDVHCLITFNSIAATEALLLGKPAITLGPNAAHLLCSNSLTEVEKLKVPTLDEVEEWAAHLAYSQFTEEEMRNGYAWSILNENSNISSSGSAE